MGTTLVPARMPVRLFGTGFSGGWAKLKKCSPVSRPLLCASRLYASFPALLGLFALVQAAVLVWFLWPLQPMPVAAINAPVFWPADWAEDREPGTLRVGLCPAASSQAFFSPFGPGLEREVLERFAAEERLVLAWSFPRSAEEALVMLRNGDLDLEAGYDGPLPSDPDLKYTPSYPLQQVSSLRGTDTAGAAARERLQRTLAASSVLVRGNGDAALPSLWKTPTPLAVSDGLVVRRHVPHFGAGAAALSLRPVSRRCVWREDAFLTPQKMAAFWQRIEKEGSLANLRERYFGFWNAREDSLPGLGELSRTLEARVSPYARTIREVCRQYGVDPLLVVALIYHESRFDPDAQSPTGPGGIMQIAMQTARFLHVDPWNAHASIEAGVRYLRIIWNDLAKFALDPWARWCVTLAAYDQGPSFVERALRLYRDEYGTGRGKIAWSDLKRVASVSRGGDMARMAEAVGYVERIRHTYALLYGSCATRMPLSPAASSLADLSSQATF